MPFVPSLPFAPVRPIGPVAPVAPVTPGAPGMPSMPLMPSTPFCGIAVTSSCTCGERRLSVTAPLAMFDVWMRPVASAVPPAIATNAAIAQATVTLVRMVVDPFRGFVLADPSALCGQAGADRSGGRSGTKEDMEGGESVAPPEAI